MASTPDVATFRPRRLRVLVIVATVALVGITAVGWFGLPSEVRLLFTLSQRLTLLGVLAVLVGVIAAVAASYIRVDDQGLQLRNGLRTHEVPWARVHKIILRPGDPWALLLIKPATGEFQAELDAEKRMVMGIQAHDGPVAVAAVDEIRRRLQVSRSRET
jgi:hypothetical protein